MFFTVWPLKTSRHKLITSQLYMREIYDFVRVASQLANPFVHPSQVRTQVLVLQTCFDLRESVWPGLNYRFSSCPVLTSPKTLCMIKSCRTEGPLEKGTPNSVSPPHYELSEEQYCRTLTRQTESVLIPVV